MMQCVGKVCGKLLLFCPNLVADKKGRASRLAGDASAPRGESKTGRLDNRSHIIRALMYIVIDVFFFLFFCSLKNRKYLVLVWQILFDFFFNQILLVINCRGGVASRWEVHNLSLEALKVIQSNLPLSEIRKKDYEWNVLHCLNSI